MNAALHAAPLRSVTTSDAPYPGHLLAGDPPLVRTDARLWVDNPGWRASADGHVLAPVDLYRDATGSAVLVPHCPRRLSDVVGAHRPIAPGEVVTVAVSMLRGAAEADALGATCGTWWVTTAGRPVLATAGSAPWRPEALSLLELLASGSPSQLSAALHRAMATLESPATVRREGAAVEDVLFAAAEPEPLRIDSLAPVRARAVQTSGDAEASRSPASAEAIGAQDGLLSRLVMSFAEAPIAARIVGLFGRVQAFRAGVRSRERPRKARRPLWVAGAIAVAIVIVGALWPGGDSTGVRAGADETPLATASPDGGDASPTPTHSGRTRVAPVPLKESAREVLERYAECAGVGCGADVVEHPSRTFPEGPASAYDHDQPLRVVDDYGGVAAIRVGESPGQVVVMVRVNDTWLVRDIYDVAHQP